MQTDPTTTHAVTTAAVPEWAAEVAPEPARATIDRQAAHLRHLLAENARLRAENKDLDCAIGHITDIERKGHAELVSLKRELADVKAECCRLVDRNGDLEAENERLRGATLSVIRSGIVDGGKVVVASYWFDRLAKEVQ